MLELAVEKRLGDHLINAAFSAAPGITVLFGPSGAGKSSILNMISGLLRPDGGHIRLNGRDLHSSGKGLPPEQRRIGHVFQDGLLFPHLTVRQNLLFGAPHGGRLQEIVRLMDLDPLLERRPRTLSGGETQRVAIGRALLSEPEALLLDEPMASLDDARKERLLPYLKQLRQKAGIPVVHVTHAVDEAFRLADQIVLLDQGRVTAMGPPEDVFAPQAGHQQSTLPTGGILTGEIRMHHPDDRLTELAIAEVPVFVQLLDRPAGEMVRLRLDGSDIVISTGDSGDISILNRLPATLTLLDRSVGGRVRLQLELSDGQRLAATVTSRAARQLGLQPGQAVVALFKAVSVTQGQLDL